MDPSNLFPIATTVAAILVGAASSLYFGYNSSKELSETERKADAAIDDLFERLSASENDRTNSTDLTILLELNREQLNKYHAQTRSQASKSFYASLFAMFLGLLVLGAGAAVILQPDASLGRTIAVSVLTSVGAAVSGYVSATFIRAHDKSLTQLNFYFQQPVVASYFLATERLSTLVQSEERRTEILERIVDRTLNVADQVSRDAGRFVQSGGEQDRTDGP